MDDSALLERQHGKASLAFVYLAFLFPAMAGFLFGYDIGAAPSTHTQAHRTPTAHTPAHKPTAHTPTAQSFHRHHTHSLVAQAQRRAPSARCGC